MKSFWKIVNDVISISDILLEVLDARFVDETRNIELEDKIRQSNKKLIFVLNKCDLVEKQAIEKQKKKLKPAVFVSATKRYGITMLLHEIQKNSPNKEKVVVGIVGYPNTGKSSVINALKGRASAPVSSQSGFTKAMQLIKVTGKIYLLDTPGVFSYMEKGIGKHALRASVDFTKIKDPEAAAVFIIEGNKDAVSAHYLVKKKADTEEMLAEIAFKLNRLKKGGVPDIKAAAQALLKDWQRGKIKT
ncbi:MAG: 50S ribosome-binding GTPase [Nanoarchaeota archaeon]|nr:50S ribosome-binding GTPase [Nanoarchaeota archaeon]